MKAEPMKTLTISLSPRQVSRLQDAIQSGSYASSSEVIRDALRLWEQREENRQLEVARLKRAHDDGMASVEGREIDRKVMLDALKAEARTRG
jgi:antitoxin ParD1/3/4